MTSDDLVRNLPAAEEALGEFLKTLVGAESTLVVEPPGRETTSAPAAADFPFIVGFVGSEPVFIAAVDSAWLGALSAPLLGESLSWGEAGASDFALEIAAQAYGSVRNRLAADDVRLPEVAFEVQNEAPAAPACGRIAFSLRVPNGTLDGTVFLPVTRAASPPTRSADSRTGPNPSMHDHPIPVAPAAFPNLGHEFIGGDGSSSNFGLLAEVDMEITVELGRRRLPLADLLRLTNGSVIELEKLVGEPLEVYANGRLIAEGEAVVIDEQFGIRITSLASGRQRAKAFL
jgi:flagellar motor switch protein FliN